MKIAFCIENFKPARGGAERYVYNLSHLLSIKGHQVHIFALEGSPRVKSKIRIHVVRVPLHPKFLRTICFAVRIRSRVRKERFDIIHSFGRTWGMDVFQPLGGSQMASLVGNLRSISTWPGRIFKAITYIFSIRRLSYFLVEKIQMREAKLVIAISPMVRDDLLHYNHLNSAQIRIVRNGINLDKFNPRNVARYRSRTRQQLRLEDRDILILFVAHNFRLKGLYTLILALAYLRRERAEERFKLAVLGEGRIKQFRRVARKNKVDDQVIFLGGRDDTHRYYSAADLCVHPSFYDPSALVVLEAMASGLPVITSNFCGTSEIIEEGKEGYVVANPGDIPKFAGAIFKLIDPALRREMGRHARREAEKYPYHRNMQEILKVYNECIDNSSRSPGPQL